jgi:hypothetical protein
MGDLLRTLSVAIAVGKAVARRRITSAGQLWIRALRKDPVNLNGRKACCPNDYRALLRKVDLPSDGPHTYG